MLQFLLPIIEEWIVASAGSGLTQQVVRSLVSGKQKSALLKVANPQTRTLLKGLKDFQKSIQTIDPQVGRAVKNLIRPSRCSQGLWGNQGIGRFNLSLLKKWGPKKPGQSLNKPPQSSNKVKKLTKKDTKSIRREKRYLEFFKKRMVRIQTTPRLEARVSDYSYLPAPAPKARYERRVIRQILERGGDRVPSTTFFFSSWCFRGKWVSRGQKSTMGNLYLTTKVEQPNGVFKRIGGTYYYPDIPLRTWAGMRAAIGREGTGAGTVFWRQYLDFHRPLLRTGASKKLRHPSPSKKSKLRKLSINSRWLRNR